MLKQIEDANYKVGQLTALLKMVYETVDEKHMSSTLRELIISQIK